MKRAVVPTGLVLGVLLATACATTADVTVRSPLTVDEIVAGIHVPVDRYTLSNGLDVVLHPDRSDPIVSVAIMFHVGSARETPDRTGFAHLFEHILFQESENVPQDTFFRKIQEAGGTLNGGTWQDGTIYYEVVPKNALEMVLWMESDRMGFLLGALDDEAFHNQQLVVMNEKRQRVDNQPYGHRSFIINKILYPEQHPYNWQVIGSMEHLASATLEDVRDFFRKWYGPNNATLVIAGDYDEAQVKQWVEKYFGEIPSGPAVDAPEPVPAGLDKTPRPMFEDSFATVPELTLVWPTVPAFHRDEAPLDLLSEVLVEGKTAVLYKRLVEEKKLTSKVTAQHSCGELAGTFQIRVRSLSGGALDVLYNEIVDVLDKVDRSFVDETRLRRIKAQFENAFYNRVASVFSKSMTLAMYNAFLGKPDFIREDLARYLRVSQQDVNAVFDRYIKGRPHIVLSIVPRGQASLAVADSQPFAIPDDAGVKPLPPGKAPVAPQRTPSGLDRSVEPGKGPVPRLSLPRPYHHEFTNGMALTGIVQPELPIVHFAVDIRGGHRADPPGRSGVARLTAVLLKEGTEKKTPAELEEALELLGTYLSIDADSELVTLRGYCLARNFGATMELVGEILAEPRFDSKEFERLKQKTLTELDQHQGLPAWLAQVVLLRRLFGDSHVWRCPTMGTRESVGKITLDDVKSWHGKWIRPGATVFTVAGQVTDKQVVAALALLEDQWERHSDPAALRSMPAPPEVKEPQLFLVDVPDAPQSEIRAGRLAMPLGHPDYYPAYLANYTLGGNFNSRLNLILREEKGYTYGVRTGFHSGIDRGLFTASSAVQGDATADSLRIFREEIARTSQGAAPEELEFTRQSLLNSMMREFETLGSLLDVARDIGVYRLPADYVARRQETLLNITADKLSQMAVKYLPADEMIYLIVGDRKTVEPQLDKLQMARPVLLDREGNVIDKGKTE